MSKNVAMFVDVANLYYAARGQDVDVDYVALLKAATKGRDLIRAYAYSGLDPENENQRKFIEFLGKNGYKVITKDIRKFGDGRVKANLDIELVVDLFRLAKRMDIAVIVSGDGDFAPAIRALQDEGVRCEVISFRPNTSSDLIAVADEFIDIMKVSGIGRGKAEKAEKGMPTPEMPAKEVVPEFGFREASPGVAAAALAALRGGGGAGGRTSVRGGRGRAEERPEVSVEEPVLVAADTAGENGERRRRRRRGGRGRGRGRGREGEAGAAVAGEPGEIGWQELDDLSQLDDLGEEREYSFEEADEATLAELGLLDAQTGGREAAVEAEAPEPEAAEPEAAEPEAAEPEAQAEEEKPKRRRATRTKAASAETESDKAPRTRRRSSKAEAQPSPAEEAETVAGEKKPARRRSTRKGAATAEPGGTDEEAAGDAGQKREPARRSSRRGSKRGESQDAGADEGSADQEGEPEGIWQRFRSARGS